MFKYMRKSGNITQYNNEVNCGFQIFSFQNKTMFQGRCLVDGTWNVPNLQTPCQGMLFHY